MEIVEARVLVGGMANQSPMRDRNGGGEGEKENGGGSGV